MFRKSGGGYGLVCANGNTTTELLVFDTEELITYENQRVIDMAVVIYRARVWGEHFVSAGER